MRRDLVQVVCALFVVNPVIEGGVATLFLVSKVDVRQVVLIFLLVVVKEFFLIDLLIVSLVATALILAFVLLFAVSFFIFFCSIVTSTSIAFRIMVGPHL